MTQQMLTWCLIAAVLMAFFMIRTLIYIISRSHRHAAKSHPLITMATEEEMLFIPGDDERD